MSSRWGEIFTATLQTAAFVLIAVGVGLTICLAVGVFSHRYTAFKAPSLAIASVLLTVPSLALFALFIPIFGIGNPPVVVALILYTLLPILRNTVTGLDEVDPSIVEASRGVGLSNRQRLTRVEMPLAWPVILTGIRVAVLLNCGVAAIAPLVGGDGLGVFVQDGLTRYPLPTSVERTWTGVVFTVLLALALDLALGGIGRATTPKGIRT